MRILSAISQLNPQSSLSEFNKRTMIIIPDFLFSFSRTPSVHENHHQYIKGRRVVMLIKQINFRYISLKFINKIGWKKNLPMYSIIYSAQTPPSKRHHRLLIHTQYLSFHIGAFLFLSLTLHYDLFETLLGFTLENINELTTFYILYAILIVLLKVIAGINSLVKK